MKLGVSNIAWPIEEEDACLKVLKENGCRQIEVAPTKYWPNLMEVTPEMVAAKRLELAQKGIGVISAQALLFGRPDLKVFGTDSEKFETLSYLKRVIDICTGLGAKALVFGSPKNRIKGARSFTEAVGEVRPFFSELGAYAAGREASFCIEPNAVGYGCDFVTNVDEAIVLVESVATAGFGLHLDSGNMIMANESVTESISKAQGLVKHFHISAPKLEPVVSLSGLLTKNDWSAISNIQTKYVIENLLKSNHDHLGAELINNYNFVVKNLGF